MTELSLKEIQIFFQFIIETCVQNPAGSIAFLALFLTIWQGWLSRRHNILSVRPSLILMTNSERLQKRKRQSSIKIKNTGLGPAEIIDYTIGKSGEGLILGKIDPDAWGFILSERCGLKDVDLTSVRLGKERFIAPGEEIELLKVTYSKPQDREFDIHRETGFAIKYKSLYGESFYSGYGSIKPRVSLLISRLVHLVRRIKS